MVKKKHIGLDLMAISLQDIVCSTMIEVDIQGNRHMKLSAKSGGEIAIELDGQPGGPIPINTPLGPLGFRNGWLTGLFFGTIPTEDANRSSHVVFLRLHLKGDTLSGTVSAVAANQTFALPYWASLKRK